MGKTNRTMSLVNLQHILGERIYVAMDKSKTAEERDEDNAQSTVILGIAKQMINNGNLILNIEKMALKNGKTIDDMTSFKLING